VVDQHGIAGIQAAVGPPVHREFLAADPDVGVFARHVAPYRSAVLITQALRLGRLGAVAIGDYHRVAAYRGFYAAHQQIVLPAARGQQADSRYDAETRH
jgi:hypothetical protein